MIAFRYCGVDAKKSDSTKILMVQDFEHQPSKAKNVVLTVLTPRIANLSKDLKANDEGQIVARDLEFQVGISPGLYEERCVNGTLDLWSENLGLYV